jgi:hypothetical protein
LSNPIDSPSLGQRRQNRPILPSPSCQIPYRSGVQHWQNNPDLAAIRDPATIAKLPAGEREACKNLWADVAELLKKIEAMKSPTTTVAAT